MGETIEMKPKFKYFVMYRVGDLVHFAPCPTWEKALVEMADMDARDIGRHHLAVNLPEKVIMVKSPLTHGPLMCDPNFWLDEYECRAFDLLGISPEGFILRSVYRDREFLIELRDKNKKEGDGNKEDEGGE